MHHIILYLISYLLAPAVRQHSQHDILVRMAISLFGNHREDKSPTLCTMANSRTWVGLSRGPTLGGQRQHLLRETSGFLFTSLAPLRRAGRRGLGGGGDQHGRRAGGARRTAGCGTFLGAVLHKRRDALGSRHNRLGGRAQPNAKHVSLGRIQIYHAKCLDIPVIYPSQVRPGPPTYPPEPSEILILNTNTKN